MEESIHLGGLPRGHTPPLLPPLHSAASVPSAWSVIRPMSVPALGLRGQGHPTMQRHAQPEAARSGEGARPASPGCSLAPALDDGCVLLGLEGVAGGLGGGLQLTRQVVAMGQRHGCEATGRHTQVSLLEPAWQGAVWTPSRSSADHDPTPQPAQCARFLRRRTSPSR